MRHHRESVYEPQPYVETKVGNPNPDYSEAYVQGTTPYIGKADGGIVDKLEEMYDLRETYPTQFDNAVNSFTGEMGKIWDFWKDTLGLRRGGHVGFKR